MGRPARILIIDDSASVRADIRRNLEEAGFEADLFEADSGLAGFKSMLENEVDLVFCDLVMPEIDGLKFLQLREGREELSDIPVLMLTSIEDMEQKVRLLSSGASDYLIKPFHAGELVARARIHLKIKQLQDELRAKNEKLTELSTTDALTKVYNRRQFIELAGKEFQRSRRNSLDLSMLLFDVDHFKDINDTFGHPSGDDVLVRVCREVEDVLRRYDIFARYGGDEFTVLFPQTRMADALSVAERISQKVYGMKLSSVQEHPITISGGLTSLSGEHESIESLLKAADKALYMAKKRGRGRIVARDRG